MNENEKLVIDISSAVLKDPQSAGWLSAAEERAAASGAVLGIQVHNSASEDDLEKALKSSLPLSFHAPVLGRYMINLAAEDCTESWKQTGAENASGYQQFGTGIYSVENDEMHAGTFDCRGACGV